MMTASTLKMTIVLMRAASETLLSIASEERARAVYTTQSFTMRAVYVPFPFSAISACVRSESVSASPFSEKKPDVPALI